MSGATALTASSDVSRELPSRPEERLDRAAVALASLRAESRRLERLGLEVPLARCHQQLRYWEFLAALFAIESESR